MALERTVTEPLPPARRGLAAIDRRLGAAGEGLLRLQAAVAAGEVTFISVGPQCRSAAILRRLGLRSASYPFDWLFSSLGMVEHCLDDDFRTFLDPDEHDTVPLEERPDPHTHRTHHRFYRSMGIDFVFNHHEMPESLAHFQRAVDRFRSAPNPIFVHIARKTLSAGGVKRLRAKLRGPLLAYLVMAKQPERTIEERPAYSLLNAHADVTPLGFQQAEDEALFAKHLIFKALPFVKNPALANASSRRKLGQA
jgi:hypothetical protein